MTLDPRKHSRMVNFLNVTRDAARGLVDWVARHRDEILVGVVVAVIVALVIALFDKKVTVHARAWLIAVVVAALVLLPSMVWRWLHPSPSTLDPDTEALQVLRRQLEAAQNTEERWEAYAEHIRQILGHLQEFAAGTLPGFTHMEMLERGVLEPARDMLERGIGEDIRLSILAPLQQDKTKFRMVLAAGHTVAGKAKFRIDVDESLSRFAYRKGEAHVWRDVDAEPAYAPHPDATRPYRSMISLPVHGGEKIHGVFNVVCTLPGYFEDVDVEYIKLLGSIVDVITSMIMADQSRGTGDA